MFAAITAYLDCNVASFPWDVVPLFPASFSLGVPQTLVIPLATTVESVLGANICGQLQVRATVALPLFCTLISGTLNCNPTLITDVGFHSVTFVQEMLEHPSSAKQTTFNF